MAIPLPDTKLLWARSAGICANPECRADLTEMVSVAKAYVIGEMAHIIADSEGGPRGQSGGGEDTYENLVLLCPSCHKRIDKSPMDYPIEMLLSWKENHEASIRQKGAAIKCVSRDELVRHVSRLLVENRLSWKEFGPESEVARTDPGSNAHLIWEARKLDQIIPNNWQIVNLFDANKELLSVDDYTAFIKFKLHAQAFEQNQYQRLDGYPTFPTEFGERFGG